MVVDLHGAGYVHRNIKPTNVLRHLRKHEWVLSDHACTAPIGVHPLRVFSATPLLATLQSTAVCVVFA